MLTLATLLLLVPNTLFSLYVLARQYKAMNKPQPANSRKIQSEDDFNKSVAYGKSRYAFQLVMALLDMFKEMLALYMLPTFFRTKLKHLPFANELFNIFHSLVFSILLSIPSDFYYDFVIEAKYGFNKKKVSTFFKDTLLNAVVYTIIIFPVSFCAFKLISTFTTFYFYLWLFFCLITVLISIIYPAYISPLYNTFNDLPNGELKADINKLANKIGFKIGSISVMDGSLRSAHGNAYFTGIGPTKKIVLYDTMLKLLNESNREVLAVLCHEFGHWALSHTYVNLIISFIYSFVFLYAFNCTFKDVASDELVLHAFRFMYYASAFAVPISLLRNLISRKMERQADEFAASHGYADDLKRALVKITTESKVPHVVDPLFSAVNFSHPPLLERLEHIDSLSSKLD